MGAKLNKHQKLLVVFFVILFVFGIIYIRYSFGTENNNPSTTKARQRIVPSAAPEDIRNAFRKKFGKGSDETVLSELETNQKRVLPSSIFTYFGSGFTPGGEVMITVGPLEGADTIVELTSADPKGHIKGSMEMPERNKIVLGQNMIIAMDYREMRNAIENVLTGKNNILSSYAAAQLLEVVGSE